MQQFMENKYEQSNLNLSIVKSRVLTHRFEAHAGLFRLLMEGIFGPYVL